MQENNQSTEIQTSGGLEQGSMSSLAKEKSFEFSGAPDLSGAGFLQAKRAEHVPSKNKSVFA
jgi:hypothetical protein